MTRPRLSDRYNMATGRKRPRWLARLRYTVSGIVWRIERGHRRLEVWELRGPLPKPTRPNPGIPEKRGVRPPTLPEGPS